MEEKINIAEILKDKSKGIRLYSPIFGECSFSFVREDTNDICVKKHNGEKALFDSKGLYNILGECLLFPSKEMRDWSKFLWKKGDILVSNDNDRHIIFEGFSKDDYTTFEGKYWINVSKKRYVSYLYMQKTQNYHIEYDKDATQTYINTIEEIFGDKLNRETLEIEKQPEFKDGDVLFVKCNDRAFIEIFKYSKKNGDLYDHASLDTTTQYLDISGKLRIGKDEITELRLATEEEKKQFFSALANKGKDWDSEKKKVVNLKTKFDELKPFDKVVVRCSEADRWSIDFFSYKVSNGYICTGDAWFGYCLPYNDETAHLLGTTDDWKGGEE